MVQDLYRNAPIEIRNRARFIGELDFLTNEEPKFIYPCRLRCNKVLDFWKCRVEVPGGK